MSNEIVRLEEYQHKEIIMSKLEKVDELFRAWYFAQQLELTQIEDKDLRNRWVEKVKELLASILEELGQE